MPGSIDSTQCRGTGPFVRGGKASGLDFARTSLSTSSRSSPCSCRERERERGSSAASAQGCVHRPKHVVTKSIGFGSSAYRREDPIIEVKGPLHVEVAQASLGTVRSDRLVIGCTAGRFVGLQGLRLKTISQYNSWRFLSLWVISTSSAGRTPLSLGWRLSA